MSTTDQAYMLDTTEFNHLLKGEIPPAFFAGHRLLVTRIQEDELRATTDGKNREALLAVYKKVAPTEKHASSFAFDIEGAGHDQAYWNDGSGNYKNMLDRLRVLDTKKKKRKDSRNQMRDILIAETAIKNAATLVSGDCNLRQVVSEFGGCAIDHLPV